MIPVSEEKWWYNDEAWYDDDDDINWSDSEVVGEVMMAFCSEAVIFYY